MFDKKSFFKKFIFSKIFLVTGIIILVFLTVAFVKKMARDYGVEAEIKKLRAEISELQNTNNEFNELVGYLSTENFLEEEARTKLGLAVEGEKMIVIKNEAEKKAASEAAAKKLNIYTSGFLQKDEPKEISNPARWWNYFFRHEN